jgi:hypothetical protein
MVNLRATPGKQVVIRMSCGKVDFLYCAERYVDELRVLG